MAKPRDDDALFDGAASRKALDLYAAMRESTASAKAKVIDRDRLELKQHFRAIIERGTEQDLSEALTALGIGAETPEAKELLGAFRELREKH